MAMPVGPLRAVPALTRHPSNPVLAPTQVPYPAHLTFNAGVTKFRGKYVMVFRSEEYENPGRETFRLRRLVLGLAESDDGVRWTVRPKPCFSRELVREDVASHAYDPRLTVIDGRCYMCFVIQTYHGLRGGIAVTDDFERWDILHLTLPDNRNMVLFPERVGGKYLRLDRPFPIYARASPPGGTGTRFDLWCSASPDLRYWGDSALVLGVEHVPFANDKIGPGAPPVRTPKGWLTTFHAVDIDDARGKNGWETAWKKRYTMGIMLLDLDDPRKVIGMSREPILVPEADYETAEGFRTQVLFPGGMILEDSGEVKIYYGAADTVECLATGAVDDLLALCQPVTLERL